MNWILSLVEKRIERLIQNKHTGNIRFQVNMFQGGISNMNINEEESVKPQPKKEEGNGKR